MITKPNALTRHDPIILWYAQMDLIKFIKESSQDPVVIPTGLSASELLSLADEVVKTLALQMERDK